MKYIGSKTEQRIKLESKQHIAEILKIAYRYADENKNDNLIPLIKEIKNIYDRL